MARSEDAGLQALVQIVVEDAEAACHREEDRALNEARRLTLEAEDRVGALEQAAHALGRTRGEAIDVSEVARAESEVAAVRAGAADALFDRFQQRLLLRLRALPEDARYPAALEHWAREAAEVLDGPADVFAARRDRAAIYAALLAAGAEDFQVHVDHGVHVGFVLRDLDGRTLLDRRPEALIESQSSGLRALLEQRISPFTHEPASESEASSPP